MSGRFITVDECAVLEQELETRGPTRQLSARISGRLSLYGMIDEGPRGWSITAEGRKMLKSGRVAPRTPQELILSMRPCSPPPRTWPGSTSLPSSPPPRNNIPSGRNRPDGRCCCNQYRPCAHFRSDGTAPVWSMG